MQKFRHIFGIELWMFVEQRLRQNVVGHQNECMPVTIISIGFTVRCSRPSSVRSMEYPILNAMHQLCIPLLLITPRIGRLIHCRTPLIHRQQKNDQFQMNSHFSLHTLLNRMLCLFHHSHEISCHKNHLSIEIQQRHLLSLNN